MGRAEDVGDVMELLLLTELFADAFQSVCGRHVGWSCAEGDPFPELLEEALA
jgi:hypothetical protein